MKKSLHSKPDEFSLFPMLALLPNLGEISSVANYETSFFARLERVDSILKEEKENSDLIQELKSEQEMLKVVLDWVSNFKED